MGELRITRTIQQTLGRIDGNIFQVLPGLIRQLFEKREWENIIAHKTQMPFKSFLDYCEADDVNGLNIKLDRLMQLCDSAPDVVELLERETSVRYQKQVRDERIKELRGSGMTQREIAEEVGLSRNRVSEIVSENSVITQKTDKSKRNQNGYRITTHTKPQTAAAKIREVFGDEFAEQLREAL